MAGGFDDWFLGGLGGDTSKILGTNVYESVSPALRNSAADFLSCACEIKCLIKNITTYFKQDVSIAKLNTWVKQN